MPPPSFTVMTTAGNSQTAVSDVAMAVIIIGIVCEFNAAAVLHKL